MAILNRFSAILLFCDPTHVFASSCGISDDSRPAIMGIMRFAIRDSVPLSSQLLFCLLGFLPFRDIPCFGEVFRGF